MLISEIFETKIEEKIEPVIKVGDIFDEKKLASEIGSFIVTPTLEKYIDDFLENFTDTIHKKTEEIGIWISGYFGSGKSHLAKMLALITENRVLDVHTATERFKHRVPQDSLKGESIKRNLDLISYCNTKIMGFNINSVAEDKNTSLSKIILSEYYKSRGYSNNLLYARVIEWEMDKQDKLERLHQEVEHRTRKSWKDVIKNMSFYKKHLFGAVCEIAPDLFHSREEVEDAIREAEKGELFNARFVVETILNDIEILNKKDHKPHRFMLILDETGQWVGEDENKIDQLQAFIEEIALKGKGKIWISLTTHEEMEAILKPVIKNKPLFKKIEDRFRHRIHLTTENIEMVVRDRLFKKNISGKEELEKIYDSNAGVIKGVGELPHCERQLPSCEKETFVDFYPFFPYQIHLIPEVIKSLRTRGGRGEQLSGSTRTLLAITQDVVRSGKRGYLNSSTGKMVTFDEIYSNIEGEGEIPAEARKDIGGIVNSVKNADHFTLRTAQVLFLIKDIPFLPKTKENIAKFLVGDCCEDFPTLITKVEGELKKLQSAKMVSMTGEEYEYLSGEKRTFEEEVAEESQKVKQNEREQFLEKYFIQSREHKDAFYEWLKFRTVPYLEKEFKINIFVDNNKTIEEGFVNIRIFSPLENLMGKTIHDLENKSNFQDEKNSIFVLLGSVENFDEDLNRYIAMESVINYWVQDKSKSDDARNLAMERKAKDLQKLKEKVIKGFEEGIRKSWIAFRGGSQALHVPYGEAPGHALRSKIAEFFPSFYPQYEKVKTKIYKEQKDIEDVLLGNKELSSPVRSLNLYDRAGQLNENSPVIDGIIALLSRNKNRQMDTLGKDLMEYFEKPPYGWDVNAVRVGLSAMLRAGRVKILIEKKPYTDPRDKDLQDTLKSVSRFKNVSIILEETTLSQNLLTGVRTFLIALTGNRKMDEEPSSLSSEFEKLAGDRLKKARDFELWAKQFPIIPDIFEQGKKDMEDILALSSPSQRIMEIDQRKETLSLIIPLIHSLHLFRDKNGEEFIRMMNFYKEIDYMDRDKISDQENCMKFLNNFRVVLEKKTFHDKSNWKILSPSFQNALMEMNKLLSQWKKDAKKQAEELKKEVNAENISVEFKNNIIDEINSFISEADALNNQVKISRLPENTQKFIKEIRSRIEDEKIKVTTADPQEKSPQIIPAEPVIETFSPPTAPKPKPKTTLYLKKDLNLTTITSLEEWNIIKNNMDEKIREILSRGNNVELI